MKIRNGFVSNSSSSSFVVLLPENFNVETFVDENWENINLSEEKMKLRKQKRKMRKFFKASVHTCSNLKDHEKYYDESYNIKQDPSGFLVCRNKDGHFKNWIDLLHHPRTDIDINLYAKDVEKNGFKNMEKELLIISKFFKTIKKSKMVVINKLVDTI